MSKKVFGFLSSSFVAIGGIIGAGFASGREIYTFFEGENRAVVVGAWVFVLMLVFSLTVSFFGKERGVSSMREFSRGLLPKMPIVFDIAFLFCLYIVLSAMLSAIDELFSFVGIDFPIFSTISIISVMFFVTRGIKGVKQANFVLTPILIISIAAITASFNGTYYPENAIHTKIGINSFLYVSMNFCLAAEVMAECGKDMTKKECVISSLATSFVIAVLVALFIRVLSKGNFKTVAIPLLDMVEDNMALRILATITLYFAIMTTILSSCLPVYSFWKETQKGAVLPLVATVLPPFCISKLGFIKILSSLYPLQSYIGIAAILSMLIGTLLPAFREAKRGNK